MIKFRVWDKDYYNYDWHDPSYDDIYGTDLNEIFENEKVEFEQFTGLKDMNGKDIYVGDIVKSGYKYAQPKVSQIISEDGNSYILGEDLATGNEMLVSDHFNEIEVIGNIHENLELLEANE